MRSLLGWGKGASTLAVLLWLLGSVSGTQPTGGVETAIKPGESPQVLSKPSAAPHGTRKAVVRAAYGRLPLHFEANHGQTDDQVKFLTRGRGYTVFLTPTEAVLVSSPPHNNPPPPRATN